MPRVTWQSIILEHKPDAGQPMIFFGKGITFDSKDQSGPPPFIGRGPDSLPLACQCCSNSFPAWLDGCQVEDVNGAALLL